MLSKFEDVKKCKQEFRERKSSLSASICCILSVCLSCQLSVRGLTSPNSWSLVPLISPPPHTSCPTTPPKRRCPPCLLISVYVCVFTVCTSASVVPLCLCASNDVTGPKRGSVSGGGGLSWGCRDNSIIHPVGGRTGGLSLWKAFKREKKKSWGFRKQSLMGK